MTGDTAWPAFTLTPGPSGATPATLAAMGRPILHHQDPAFLALYAETAGLLRRAFGATGDPVILPGEAVVGLEAAAASLIAPGDAVLNLVSGPYGRAFGHTARQYAGEVTEIEVGYDSAVPAGRVRDVLRARPDIRIVSAVHGETPCGTVNDLGAISAAMAGHDALLLVDAVSTFGGTRCDVAGWQPGVVVAAPQKCLGGPPGLSLLHVSDTAWRHIAANPRAPGAAALSLAGWRDAQRGSFPYTPPVTEIYALHACLEQYLAEGPDAVLARHQAAARATRAGVRALGLRLWAADESICADTVTAVRMPPGVSEADVRAVARSESGVMLSGGQGGLPVLQIGHMGPSAHPLAPVIAVVALGRALRRAGATADVGAAVEAVLGEDSYRGAIRPECHRSTESAAGPYLPPDREAASEWLPKTSGFGSRPQTCAALRCCQIFHLVNLCRMWPDEGLGMVTLSSNTSPHASPEVTTGTPLSTAAWYAGSRTSRSPPLGGIDLSVSEDRTVQPSPSTTAVSGIADPAPLGLAAFALTTFLLSAKNAGWMTHATGNAWLGYAFAYGGLAQLLAGMWEFRNRNVFGATAFATYGGFWIGLGLWVQFVANPAVAAIKPATAAATVASLNHDLGWILLAFVIFNTYMMILSTQVNMAVFAVFLTLELTEIILCIGNFTAGSALQPTGTIKFGGYVGVITALVAWYTSAAGVSNGIAGRLRFPVGRPLIG